MTHRVLLDCSSLMYRSYFSHPTSITDGRGQPVNAVMGYLDMTGHLVSTRRPDEIVHCYDDDWRPAPRVAIYEGYKSTRLPDPPGLPEQFGILREVLDAFGMPQCEAPGWEAEDAIGCLCAVAKKDDLIEAVTGDRDLIQLVRDPVVRVLFTLKGVSKLATYDEAGVFEKYGVPASRYVDFAILRGDPSDGLPGVRGVGEKTARALVQAYPSLDAMLADATAPRRTAPILQRSPSLRATLAGSGDYLAKVRQIVPIRTDLELRSWTAPRDDARIDELAERYGIRGAATRLRAALDGARRTPAGATDRRARATGPDAPTGAPTGSARSVATGARARSRPGARRAR
jgi:5'-3' exonuclease